MVSKHTTAGLIATTRVDVSSALDELATLCDWPLLLGANPRRLAREMALHNPECVLFWLDECQAVMPTAQLVAWSRERGNRPFRVAVAFQMEADTEAVFRSAGAHSFHMISSFSGNTLSAALRPLLRTTAKSKTAPVNISTLWSIGAECADAAHGHPGLVRPP